jgi:hypothetical protein
MASIQELRALNEASPFRPFRVRLPSGEAYNITSPHSIACDEEGERMSIAGHSRATGRLMDLDMASAAFEPLDDETVRQIRRRQEGSGLVPVAGAVTGFGFQPYHMYQLLRAEPFLPFTVYLFSQHHYEIKDPEAASLEDGILMVRLGGRDCRINPAAMGVSRGSFF